MNRNYKFHYPEGIYFVSFAVAEWLDVFTTRCNRAAAGNDYYRIEP